MIKSENSKKMESLENFHIMFAKAPFAIFLTDMRGIILDINKSSEKLFGYTKEELIGKNYLKFSNNTLEILSTFKDRHKKLLKSEVLDPIELQVYNKHGISIWVNALSMLIKLGENIYIQTIIQDITERKLLEQKLKESEQKYKDIAELLPVVIYEADSEYKLTYVNKIAYEKFGYSEEDFKKGLKMGQFIDPRDLKRASKDLSKFFKGELKKPQKYRLLTSDGRKLTARINSRPIYKDGKIVGIRSVLHDITEMVETEQNLKESEEKFRTITEQSLMGIVIIQDDLIKYVNQQLRELLGYNTEEIKNWKTGAFARVIHPEDKALVLEQARRKQKGLNGVITHYQYRLIKKTGEIIWVENYSKTIQYMGRPADLITIIDITKQKNAEEQIRKENTKYKQFLDTASHELKTPLTSIYGATELLKKAHKDELSAEVLELIEIAHHGSKKLKNLILNILDVSRMETGMFKFKKERFNLVNIVKDCVKDLTYSLKRRQHLICLDLPSEIYLNADKIKIERVIMNLLSNAIKYTPPKGEIKINLLRNDSYVKLIISDTGIGLTDIEIGNLFEKFSRIQRTSDEEEDLIMDGTGLGLYISKEIVNLHGGKIYVKSEGKNKGSTFTVKLPIC